MLNRNQTLEAGFNAYKARDFTRAYHFYLSLAIQGHSESQVFVGWMLYEGKGVKSNPVEALEWYKKAAASGNSRGAFYVGKLLTIAHDYQNAFCWYQTAAYKGDLPSLFRLGFAYAHGRGTKIDLPKAYQLLAEAKGRGHVYAHRELAVLDIRGKRGALRRFTGILEFIFIVISGTCLTFFDPSSEKLMG